MKVLLVENSRYLADRLSEVLGSVAGVELIGSTDTEAEAIAMMREHGADVVVLDLHLKQGTGFGVLRALAGANRKTTIIVLTNFDLPEFKKAALALGATHFLDKARDYRRLPELLAEIGNKHLARH